MPSLALLLSPLLLAAAPVQTQPAPRPASGPPAAAQARAKSPLPGRGPGAPAQDAQTLLGGTFATLGGPYLTAAPTSSPGVFHLVFNGTGTGWQEPFLVGVPPAPLDPAPLLVLFHGYAVSEWDCYRNTSLMKLAMQRGWYVLAPRGAHDMNFGVPYAQQNVEFVLDWMLATLSIDPTRVYGVGFSMGGGVAASYAARHLDPAHACFAALVDHTGTVSVSHVYYNSDPSGMQILEHPLMFGGSPAQVPFAYQRSSTIDLGFPIGQIDPSTDLARNLRHVPTQVWSADQDPLRYLLQQTEAFYGWLTGLGAPAERVVVPSSEHAWSILDEDEVLDFLEQQVLALPGVGTHRLLADRDARFVHFSIEQDSPGAFTPFRWNFDSGLNRIIVDATQNLRRITVHTASLGLDTSVDLRVIPGTQDGQPEELSFTGYPTPPSDVKRNNQSTGSWSYDALLGRVTLFESNAGSYPQWVIVP